MSAVSGHQSRSIHFSNVGKGDKPVGRYAGQFHDNGAKSRAAKCFENQKAQQEKLAQYIERLRKKLEAQQNPGLATTSQS